MWCIYIYLFWKLFPTQHFCICLEWTASANQKTNKKNQPKTNNARHSLFRSWTFVHRSVRCSQIVNVEWHDHLMDGLKHIRLPICTRNFHLNFTLQLCAGFLHPKCMAKILCKFIVVKPGTMTMIQRTETITETKGFSIVLSRLSYVIIILYYFY